MRITLTIIICFLVFTVKSQKSDLPPTYKKSKKYFFDARKTQFLPIKKTINPPIIEVSDYDIISPYYFSIPNIFNSSIKGISFKRCNIYPDSAHELGSNYGGDRYVDFIRIDSIKYQGELGFIRLNSMYASEISNSDIRKIEIFDNNTAWLFSNIECAELIRIEQSKGYLNFQNIFSKSKPVEIDINESVIPDFTYNVGNQKNVEMLFAEDTIKQLFISDFDSTERLYLHFTNCYIDGYFTIAGTKDNKTNVTCVFHNCEFGSNLRVLYGANGSIEFHDCNRFSNKIKLVAYDNKKISVRCENTKLEYINFDYLGRFKLENDLTIKVDSNARFVYFKSDDSDEVSLSNYETLLSKYKGEGKFSSYKNLDLQYRAYKAKKGGFIDRIIYYLDKVYWLHGYKKGRVFQWTLVLVLIFWIFNLITVKKFGIIYPVTHVNWHDQFQTRKPRRYKFFRAIRTLLFTAILFFSFHLNFDKLKQQTNGYMAWILFQYIIGVLSLFFIFNAVVKL